MSLAAYVVEDYSPGALLHSTPASSVMVHGLPPGVHGGREMSFNVSFTEAMRDYIEGEDEPAGLTVASLVQDEGDDRQNEEEGAQGADSSKDDAPVRELIVTDVTPPATTGKTGSVIDRIIKTGAPQARAPEANVEEEPLEVRDEEDVDAPGAIDNLAEESDFMDVGFGHSFTFADQEVD